MHSEKKERLLPLFFYSALVPYLAVAGAVFFALSFLVPNHYVPWLTFYNDLLAALALLCLFFAYVVLRASISLTAPVCFIFVLALMPLLQWSMDTLHFFGDAVSSGFYLLGFGCAFLLGTVISSSARYEVLTGFASLLVFAAVTSVFLAMHQWLELQRAGIWIIDLKPGGRPFANLGQPNNFSTLLAIGGAALLYLWERQRLGHFVAVILAIILLFGIALSQSRTAWLMGGVFVIWWLYKRQTVSLKLGWKPVIGLAGCFFIFSVGLPVVSAFLGLASGLDYRPTELGARGLIWQQVLDAVLQGPFWGYGWSQVSLAQISVVSDYPGSIYIADSHNLFLDLMVWNGLLLGGLISVLIVYWGVKNALKCHTLEVWFALLCIGFFMTHAMLELPHTKAFFLLPAGFLVGFVSKENNQSSGLFYCPRSVIFVFGVLGLCLLATIFVEYRKIEEDTRFIRFESRGIGILRAESKAPDVVLLTQLREFLRMGRTQASEGMREAEIQWMESVAHRYPLASALFRYILALALNARLEEAHFELLRLKNLYGQERYEEALVNLKLMETKYPVLEQMVESTY